MQWGQWTGQSRIGGGRKEVRRLLYMAGLSLGTQEAAVRINTDCPAQPALNVTLKFRVEVK